MRILLAILKRINKANEGTSLLQYDHLKECYMEKVAEFEESDEEMLKNRLMLRQYLRELNLYSKFT